MADASASTSANAPKTLPTNTAETLPAIRARIAQATAEIKEIMGIFLVRDLHPNMYANPDRQTAMLDANARRLTDLTKDDDNDDDDDYHNE
ncbi:hypothetical protein M5689_013191 [Euphorbia peplus]|nr:hypothetical protein M5689_013191 [Euphorbia peplus]